MRPAPALPFVPTGRDERKDRYVCPSSPFFLPARPGRDNRGALDCGLLVRPPRRFPAFPRSEAGGGFFLFFPVGLARGLKFGLGGLAPFSSFRISACPPQTLTTRLKGGFPPSFLFFWLEIED